MAFAIVLNGKDTVSVYAMNEFKGHRSRAFLGILAPQEGQKRLLQRLTIFTSIFVIMIRFMMIGLIIWQLIIRVIVFIMVCFGQLT